VPQAVRAVGARAAAAVPPAAIDRMVAGMGRLAPAALAAGRAGDKVHKLADVAAARDELDLHGRLLACWPEPRALLVEDVAPAAPREAPAGFDFAERAMLDDTRHYLVDDILAKVDRASMAVSLETRVPFLDTAVHRFAWRLPPRLRIDGGEGKVLLRRLLHRYVPAALVERPKQGFAVPVGDWLRHELRDWAEALLDPARLRREGHLRPEPVRAAWREHLAGTRNRTERLWSVLMFQAWREAWHDGTRP
jgi:asparagine synthase (glutamine-hydrolysing)